MHNEFMTDDVPVGTYAYMHGYCILASDNITSEADEHLTHKTPKTTGSCHNVPQKSREALNLRSREPAPRSRGSAHGPGQANDRTRPQHDTEEAQRRRRRKPGHSSKHAGTPSTPGNRKHNRPSMNRLDGRNRSTQTRTTNHTQNRTETQHQAKAVTRHQQETHPCTALIMKPNRQSPSACPQQPTTNST